MTDLADLHFLSASAALRLFRSRELSPVELFDALAGRLEATEPVVNAFSGLYLDQAREQAVQAERRYSGHGQPPRPLEGLTVAIKDDEAIEGHPWTQGSLILSDEIAPFTSCFAQRVIDSGAIVHGRTKTPEFCVGPYTRSRLWGITRNPWNPEYSVGGSSGGSAAALAAGSTTLATGSDIAGSIRIPSSFCGTVGFKPPYGRVPMDPSYGNETYLSLGPMARTVEDVVLLHNVIAGAHPADPNAIDPTPRLALGEGVRGARIGYSIDFGGWPVDPEVAERTLDAVQRLRDLGASVDELDLAIPQDVVDRVSSLHYVQGLAEFRALVDAHKDLLSPYIEPVLARIERWGSDGSLAEEWALSTQLHQLFASAHAEYDVLLCPTVTTVGLLADEDYVDTRLVVDGVEVDDLIHAVMTVPFNIVNRYPVLSVPSGRASNNVPTGVQIVGRPYRDQSVMTVGAALEGMAGDPGPLAV